MPAKGFTQHDINELASALAASMHGRVAAIKAKARPRPFVKLSDEAGWVVNSNDLIINKDVLVPVLLHCSSYVPGITFLMLSLIAANAMLEFGLLEDESEETAYKYCPGLPA